MSVLGQGTASASSPLPPSWVLKFSSNFSGTSVKGKVSPKVWATCYPGAKPTGCTNYGNSGTEDEWYLSSQVSVVGGVLHLTARRVATPGYNARGKPKTYECRSGMVTTYPSFNFEYGYVQFSVQVPYGKGLWPALWLAASDNKWPPEIDILEHWESQSNAGIYLHPVTGARQGGRVNLPDNLSKGWHTITLYWTKSRLTWYVDGRQMFTTTKNIPQQKMYIIMNVADTSTAAGACTGTMLVRSLRVWQP
jgi:beta-glucanase (GH16 family)